MKRPLNNPNLVDVGKATQFKEGNKAATVCAGKPKFSFKKSLENMLSRETDLEAVMNDKTALMEMMKSYGITKVSQIGELVNGIVMHKAIRDQEEWAIKLLMERTEGKPTQTIAGDADNPLAVMHKSDDKEILKRYIAETLKEKT